MYTVFDRAGGRLGFAPVRQCLNNCSAFIAPESCAAAGCGWHGAAAGCGAYIPPPDDHRLLPLYLVAGLAALLGLIAAAYILHARRRAAAAAVAWHTRRRLRARSPDDETDLDLL